jgi:phosphoribosylformylglycinamidine synthase
MFDGSAGGLNIFMPFGGKYGLSQPQSMASVIPGIAPDESRNASESVGLSHPMASVMSYGFDPFLTEIDPFGGSAHAIVVSIAKLIAIGVDLETVHLSLQEFFPRCDTPERWGLPLAALLGAFSAQNALGIAAIGGKDSMSGSFGDLDVPPTLISFAVGVGDAKTLISPEFKRAGSPVYVLETPVKSDGLPDYEKLLAMWKDYSELVKSGKVLAAHVYENSMTAPCIINMSLGNKIGFVYNENDKQTTDLKWGSIVFESSEVLQGYKLIGETRAEPEIVAANFVYPLEKVREEWETPLEKVYPTAECLGSQNFSGQTNSDNYTEQH